MFEIINYSFYTQLCFSTGIWLVGQIKDFDQVAHWETVMGNFTILTHFSE